MYQFHQNILSIPAKLLYDELKLISRDLYYKWCDRDGKLLRTKEGRGKGNQAWVSFYDIKVKWVKDAVVNYLGDPKDIIFNSLEDYIKKDFSVMSFFATHRKPNGLLLSNEKQVEFTHTAWLLEGIKVVLNEKEDVIVKKGIGKSWLEILRAVKHLYSLTDENGNKIWKFKKITNVRALQRKYNRYIESKLSSILHAGEGHKNNTKINKEIGDYLLATYCSPNKLSIPEVKELYYFEAIRNNWKHLSNSAIYNFLEKPENKRLWTFARHGKKAYDKKYKRTNTIEKSNWFPNCYWAIDGTKLDWIHYWDDSSNKMGAQLKINVLFDVYSEKIIGWDLSFTESHVEHFNAIKKGVTTSGCRPYFLTYDNQGGHKMERMRDLYTSLVAEEKGKHYPGAAKEHGNPAEGLFRRLQQQVINKFWFSDGQSITVRRDDNKMNFDFIKANKSSLKTTDELHDAWVAAVNIWNSKIHPKFKAEGLSRDEVYNHEMPMREELSLFDIMDKMWIEEKKNKLTYKAHGLRFSLAGKTHLFEVYDADGNIDIEFRRKHVGDKFIVRYDPSFLDGFVQLFKEDAENKIIHVANAQPKRTTQPVPALMEAGDKEQWLKDHKSKEAEYLRDKQDYENLKHRTGITPEKLIEDQELIIKLKGNMDKFRRSKIESEENLTLASSRL